MVHQIHINLLPRSCIAHLQDLQDGTRLVDDHYTDPSPGAPTMDARQRGSPTSFGIVLDFRPRRVLLRGCGHSTPRIETKKADRMTPMIGEPFAPRALDDPQPTGNRR